MNKSESRRDLPNEQDHREGTVAKSIERQTARLPSDTFLWLAVGAIGSSLALRMMDRKEDAVFVGEWAPTLLILGLYNKLVKIAGSDAYDRHRHQSLANA